MIKVRNFLHIFAFLFAIGFTSNAFAAGYSCPTYLKYTSCASGYYMTANSTSTACTASTPAAGNACRPCSAYSVGYTCSGGTACPVATTYTVTLDRVGGTGGDTSLMLSYNDQMPQISLPTRAGYVFDGYMDENDRWIYDSDGNPVISYWDIPYNTTLYAQWSLPQIVCSAGQYLPANATSCSTCTAGSYCPGGTFYQNTSVQGLTACPTNYTNGGTGLSAQNQCKFQTTAGNYIATANATSQTTCSVGYYCPAALVNYGNTGTRTPCPTNYTSGGTGLSLQNQCKLQTTAGSYIATANAISQTTCPAGSYCASTLVSYGSTGGATACPTNYVNGGNGLSAQNQCKWQTTAGQYIATANATTATTCLAGSYCPVASISYGSTGSIIQCTGATYAAAGAGSCSSCPTNYTANTTAGKTAASQCQFQTTAGYYIATANATGATTCPVNNSCPATLISYGSTGVANPCTACATVNASCSLSVVSNVCTYTTSCNTGYGNIVNNGSYNATCSANTYTVTLNPQSGTGGTASVTATYGSAMPAATMPTRAGYIFAGYYDSTSGGTQYYTAAGASARAWDSTTTTVLYARWTENTYIVTLDPRSGTGGTTSVNAVYGSGMPAATMPTRSGYTFNGYYDALSSGTQYYTAAGASARAWDKTTNFILYAQWTLSSVICNAGQYLPGNTSVCATCVAGNYCTGGTFNLSSSNQGTIACTTLGSNYTSSAAGSTRNFDCYIPSTILTVDKYIATTNGNTISTCANGTYHAAGDYHYGDIAQACYNCTNLPVGATYTGTGGGTNYCPWSLTCSVGKYFSYNAIESARVCATCTSGNFCTGVTVNRSTSASSGLSACPTNYVNGGTGLSSQSQCKWQTTAGTYIETANSLTSTTCPAGSYCPSTLISYGSTGTQTQCTGATYSAAGAGSCSSCPTNYTADTTDGKTSDIQCKIQTTAGYWIGTANSSTQSVCTSGYYCPAALINYGSIGTRTACPTNYTNGGTGLGAQNQCKLQTSSGRYVANAFDTATITCPVGFYCPAALVAYGDTGSTVTCPTGYDDGGSGLSTQTQCRIQTTAGNYIATANSDEQTLCLSGYYCPAALIYYGNTGTLTACPTNYDDGGAGLSAQNQCKFQTDPGYSIINANSTTQTICASGYYCPAELINYGSTGSRLSCPTNYTNGGTGLYAQNQCKFQTVGGRYIKNAGDTSQNICPAGSYCVATLVAYGNTGSIEQCTGTTYSLSNASSCSECPTNYIADTTNGKTAVSQCKIQTTAGNYIATANATTETMCLGGYYCPATLVGYGTTGSMTQCTGTTYAPPGSSSCSACPTGYESNSTAGKSSESQCQLLTTAGKYIDTANSATQVTCLAGSYCPAAMINYGSIGSITQCTGALFSGPGQGNCTGCPSGYTANTDSGKTLVSQCQLRTTAGRFIATANGTAQTDCTAGYYCPKALVNYGSTGVRLQCTGQTYSSSRQSECTACPSEYDDNPADGKTGVTQCQIQTTAGNWISTTQATEQTSCTVGYYCTGSVMVGYSQTGGRTACPTNYVDAPAGASTEGQCARQTSPGYYISIAYSISEAACLSGYYCPSELVYYGNTGSLNACPAGYVNGGTWVLSQDKCKLQTTSGKYIDTPYSNTQITCPAGYYCPGTLVEYGSTGSITQCTGATYSGAGAANCNNCPSAYSDNIDPGKTATTECQADLTPGYYLSGSTEVTCTAGSYCPGGMINYGGTAGRTNCPTNYTAGGTGLSAQNQCKILTTDGNYIATANASTQTPCISGHYCPSTLVNYGDTGSMIACLAGTYAPESSSSCTNCVIGSYSGNASSVCTACQNGTTTSVDGSASCDATCSNKDGYDSSWNSAIWNSNNTVSNSCSISGCAGGYYIATDSCTAVGSGYWSADGSATRTSCSVGLTTVGYGSGADEVGDCGRILKVGSDQVYLRSAKKTTPSLGVKVNGTTYYGNMTTEAKGNLKVKSSGTQYSVYDESM